MTVFYKGYLKVECWVKGLEAEGERNFWYPVPAPAANGWIMNRVIYLFITNSCCRHLGKEQFVNKQWILVKKEWMKTRSLVVFGSFFYYWSE